MLLPSQMNEVLGLVEDAGLDPALFEWRRINSSTTKGQAVSMLAYKKGGWRFIFDRSRETHVAVFRPGATTPEERRNTIDWKWQVSAFYEWLLYLKREIESPDLWALLSRDNTLAATLDGITDDNSAFSAQEQERIRATLNEIKDYSIAHYDLTATQTQALLGAVEYLAAASGRLGRKDWSGILIGTLFSYVLSVALPPEVARRFFTTALEMLSWVLHNLPRLTP